ncbi:MAG: response regulator [Ignavibacteriaceae bacterium]
MNKKILLVEDDPAILLGLEDYLLEQSFDVIKALDGKVGYDLALKENPDLILLDINLPSIDGIQVCRMLREQGYHNPIIILTSRGEKIDKVVGLEVGADDYVTKPFDTRELLARIRTNLRRLEAEDRNNVDSDINKDLQRHLLAIMFSDMKNYSKKMNRDEKQALKLLQDHNQIMKDSIENFKGRIVEIIGDAFLAAFESATDCLNCCIQIQEKFKDYNSEKPKHEKIKVRIGVHVGDVIEFEGKLKGDALNIAARIQQIAEPGTIYASENFYLTVKGKTDTEFRKLKTFELKNIKGKIDIYIV